MINENKVKDCYQLALYDQAQEKRDRQMGRFFRKDYLVKELIKSFFSGTAAYLLILVLWVMARVNEILDSLNTTDFLRLAVIIGLCYIAFLAIYLLITYVVYYVRYTDGRKRLKRYYGRLKVINHANELDEMQRR